MARSLAPLLSLFALCAIPRAQSFRPAHTFSTQPGAQVAAASAGGLTVVAYRTFEPHALRVAFSGGRGRVWSPSVPLVDGFGTALTTDSVLISGGNVYVFWVQDQRLHMDYVLAASEGAREFEGVQVLTPDGVNLRRFAVAAERFGAAHHLHVAYSHDVQGQAERRSFVRSTRRASTPGGVPFRPPTVVFQDSEVEHVAVQRRNVYALDAGLRLRKSVDAGRNWEALADTAVGAPTAELLSAPAFVRATTLDVVGPDVLVTGRLVELSDPDPGLQVHAWSSPDGWQTPVAPHVVAAGGGFYLEAGITRSGGDHVEGLVVFDRGDELFGARLDAGGWQAPQLLGSGGVWGHLRVVSSTDGSAGVHWTQPVANGGFLDFAYTRDGGRTWLEARRSPYRLDPLGFMNHALAYDPLHSNFVVALRRERPGLLPRIVAGGFRAPTLVAPARSRGSLGRFEVHGFRARYPLGYVRIAPPEVAPLEPGDHVAAVRPGGGKRLPPEVIFVACTIGPDGTGATTPAPGILALDGLQAQAVALQPAPGGGFDVMESTRSLTLGP